MSKSVTNTKLVENSPPRQNSEPLAARGKPETPRVSTNEVRGIFGAVNTTLEKPTLPAQSAAAGKTESPAPTGTTTTTTPTTPTGTTGTTPLASNARVSSKGSATTGAGETGKKTAPSANPTNGTPTAPPTIPDNTTTDLPDEGLEGLRRFGNKPGNPFPGTPPKKQVNVTVSIEPDFTDIFPDDINSTNILSDSNAYRNIHNSSKATRDIVRQIFLQNDIYLSNKAINDLIHQSRNSAKHNPQQTVANTLSNEIFNLIDNIKNQMTQNSGLPRTSQKHLTNQVLVEIPHGFEEEIRTGKNLLHDILGAQEVKTFSRVDINQRMIAAVEIFFRDLPETMPDSLRNYTARDVLAGFLLARGLLKSDNNYSTASLVEMLQALTANDKTQLIAMRDLGGLVKVLISDAAMAKSNSNLVIAVEKFIRIMVAVNRLDAVLAAVQLGSHSLFAGGALSRPVAIAQVYDLINQLVTAGEKAMKEAAAAAQLSGKNALQKETRDVFPAGTLTEILDTESAIYPRGSETRAAEGALRQILEFNPMFVNDRCLSVFESPERGKQAQNEFLSQHQIDVERWIQSGNHRLVMDVEFDKPLGIVVDREKESFFSGNSMRVVLVRDSSPQGWHFLKSFLVA